MRTKRTLRVSELKWMAHSEQWVTRSKVLDETNDVPGYLLAMLAEDEEDYVRVRVAHRKNLPEELVVLLAADESPRVRQMIAFTDNPIPDASMLLLAHDDNHEVLYTLSRRTDLTLEACMTLAGHDYPDMCESLAKNPHTFPEVLTRLVEKTKAKVKGISSTTVRGFVGANPNTSAETIQTLWVESEFESVVRYMVAINPSIPESLMWEAANSDDGLVHEGLSTNPNISTRVAEELIKAKNASVDANLAKNSTVPLKIVERLAGRGNLTPKAKTAIVERLIKDSPTFEGWPLDWVHNHLFDESR